MDNLNNDVKRETYNRIEDLVKDVFGKNISLVREPINFTDEGGEYYNFDLIQVKVHGIRSHQLMKLREEFFDRYNKLIWPFYSNFSVQITN